MADLIQGTWLSGTTTVSFTVSGSRHDWHVTVSDGRNTAEDDTSELSWDTLLREMARDAFDNIRRQRQREAVR